MQEIPSERLQVVKNNLIAFMFCLLLVYAIVAVIMNGIGFENFIEPVLELF